MITSLRVSNYRSLGQKVELHPGRLSVLIGPNGAGKSNVLDYLYRGLSESRYREASLSAGNLDMRW